MKKYNELGARQQEDILTIISDVKEKSIIKLYDSIVNIINTINNKESIEIIKALPRVKPKYNVQTFFDLVRELSELAYDVQGDFIELKKFIGMEIDVFIIVNMMNA